MRLWRVLFVLLVGLNLILICQGHNDADHHTGPHLTVLGEPRDASERGSDTTGAAARVASNGYSPAQAPAGNVLVRSSSDSGDGSGISSLGLFIPGGVASTLARWALALVRRALKKSQTNLKPDPPPPRTPALVFMIR